LDLSISVTEKECVKISIFSLLLGRIGKDAQLEYLKSLPEMVLL